MTRVSEDRQPGSRRGPSAMRKVAMAAVVTVAFFALAEGALALLGVAPARYASDPYVGFSGHSPLFERTTDASGREVWRTARNKWRLFNVQEFPVEKGRDVRRVFCMGGSTTYGRPYGDATSFCGWLREYLAVAAPGTRWEVVNAGGISYASYRVALLMEELAGYEPDLFVLYSGHNEFLEERTYRGLIAMPAAVRGLGALASRTRLWTAIDRAVDTVRPAAAEVSTPASTLGEEVETLLDRSVGPAAYHRDDTLREQVLGHFRYNLARMVDIGRSAGADVLLVAPASNLRHSTPFKSEPGPGLSEDERARWQGLVRDGNAAGRAGDLRRAAAVLGEAAALDPRHAHTRFALARALDGLGDLDAARGHYVAARDEDVCPLRAPSPVRDMVLEVAADRGAPVVDYAALVAARAPGGIPGAETFLDHVHPTIEGHRVLARAILDEMAKAGIVRLAPSWGEAAEAAVAARIEGAVRPLDHAMALTNLAKVLGWAGKLAEADQLVQRAVAIVPDDARIQYEAGIMADVNGRPADAERHYRRAIELQPDADLPHGDLGWLLERQGKLAEALDHYRLAVRYANPDGLEQNRSRLVSGLVTAAALLHRRGEPAAALTLLEEARGHAPSEPAVLLGIATAQMALGRGADAVANLRRVVDQRPDDAGVRNRLAIALAMVGDEAGAADAYRQAVELEPQLASSPEGLPQVLTAAGQGPLAARIVAAAGLADVS